MTVENGTPELTEQQLWDQEAQLADKPDATAVTPAEPKPAVPAAETKPAQQAEPTDPYEGLHPAIRAKLEAQDQLAERLRKTEGHIGGLVSENKRIKDELAAAKAAAEAVRNAPTQAQLAQAKASTQKWDQLKTDFPEWADALEERLGATAQPDLDGLRNQIRDELTPQLTQQISSQLKAEIAAETEGRLVNIAHRGWKDTVKSPEFVSWYEAQPADVKALGASPTAEDAITLLDSYKAATAGKPSAAQIKQQRQQRMQEAATVARGNQGGAPVKSTDDMSPEEYWNHLARQDAAKK
jgi:hypothetical protein